MQAVDQDVVGEHGSCVRIRATPVPVRAGRQARLQWPGMFGVPGSYLSGKSAGCSSCSERLPVPPCSSGGRHSTSKASLIASPPVPLGPSSPLWPPKASRSMPSRRVDRPAAGGRRAAFTSSGMTRCLAIALISRMGSTVPHTLDAWVATIRRRRLDARVEHGRGERAVGMTRNHGDRDAALGCRLQRTATALCSMPVVMTCDPREQAVQDNVEGGRRVVHEDDVHGSDTPNSSAKASRASKRDVFCSRRRCRCPLRPGLVPIATQIPQHGLRHAIRLGPGCGSVIEVDHSTSCHSRLRSVSSNSRPFCLQFTCQPSDLPRVQFCTCVMRAVEQHDHRAAAMPLRRLTREHHGLRQTARVRPLSPPWVHLVGASFSRPRMPMMQTRTKPKMTM